MVDREKRRVAADLIERLLAGTITTDDFDAGFPRDNDDPALAAIYERLWFHWDDRRPTVLAGKQALNDPTRTLFERCRDFLNSDLEYEWPRKIHRAAFSRLLMRSLGLRRVVERQEREAEKQIRAFGDYDAWPFLRAQDIRQR